MPKNQFQRPTPVNHNHQVPRHDKPVPPVSKPVPLLKRQKKEALPPLDVLLKDTSGR